MIEVRASHMQVIALLSSKIPSPIIISFFNCNIYGVHRSILAMCDDQIWVNRHI